MDNQNQENNLQIRNSTVELFDKYIVEYEQEGNPKAKYGAKLLETLARDLTLLHGRGFSRSNLSYMRLFYLRFPICEKLSHKLSWSHYCCLFQNINYICQIKRS